MILQDTVNPEHAWVIVSECRPNVKITSSNCCYVSLYVFFYKYVNITSRPYNVPGCIRFHTEHLVPDDQL